MGANGGRRDGERQDSERDEERIAHRILELDPGAGNVERDARIPESRHQHGADDAAQQQEIRHAFDRQRRSRRRRGGPRPPGDRAADRAHETARAAQTPRNTVGGASARVVQKKSTPLRNPMKSGGSPSGDSAPPTLPTRRMKKTIVCTRWLPSLVGREERPDEKHGSPRRAHDAREAGAQRQDRGVHGRRAGERAAKADAARDREEREQHGHERNVLEHYRVRDVVHRLAGAELHRERNEEQKHPRRRELAVVVVPELRRQQRRESDGKQQAGKRHPPRERQRRAIERRKHVRGGGWGDHAGGMRMTDQDSAGSPARLGPRPRRIANAERCRMGHGPPARYNFPPFPFPPVSRP